MKKLFTALLIMTVLTSCQNDEQFVEDKSFYDLPVYGKLIEQLSHEHFIMMGIKTVPNGEICYYKFDGYTRSNEEIQKILNAIDGSILEAKTWLSDKKAKKENGNNATYAKINCVTKIFEDRKNEYLKRLGIEDKNQNQLAQN